MKTSLLLVLVILLTTLSYSQRGDWNITGHLQLRSELDGRDFSNTTHPLTFTSLRTRLGVEKGFGGLNFFVQIQDSRVLGEEQNTLASIRNLDLHQGYVRLSDLFDLPMDLQAGRFEMVYGTERFFGAVGWHYVGRAWDGARLSLKPGFKLDLFALTMLEEQNYIGNAVPSIYPYPSESIHSISLYGMWASFASAGNQIDPFLYYEINRLKFNDEPILSRYTAGLNYLFKRNTFSLTFEGAYQFGEIMNTDIGAYLLSLQLMHTGNAFRFGGGADILSGTEQTAGGNDKIGYFDPAYGTNHKFYGFMDYFINIPANTRSLGLHDFYLTTGFTPAESKFSGNIWLHYFTSNQKLVDQSLFGQEIDLTLSYNFMRGTSLTWGGSIFLPGDLMKTFFRSTAVREDPAFWTYVMISAGM
jgi:hypothetical protein